MTDFMIDALELLPQPAALFELPSLRYVASNAVASTRFRGYFNGQTPTAEEVLDRLGVSIELARASLIPTGTFTANSDVGILHITKMPARPEIARPELLLATVHDEVDEHTAWMDHNRMLLSLRVNENGEVALRMLEATLVQVQATLSVQRDMLTTYNRRVGEWLEQSNPRRTKTREN